MKQNNVFGPNGLTSTSANHIANIAKEMYEALENRLQSLNFCNKDFTLAVNGNTYRVENESSREELDTLITDLKEIGELKSLIAYLREAIKAKEYLATDEAINEHIEALIEDGREDLKKPELKANSTFESVFEELEPEQKAKYFSLEARCAAIGKYIHNDGGFASARDAFFEKTKNPTKVTGCGQDVEICTFSSSFTPELIDEVFFKLQKEHRAIQAEFNKMKSELDETCRDKNYNEREDYHNKLREWMNKKAIERLKYNGEVKDLKIVIPQNLKGIYDKVSEVANCK